MQSALDERDSVITGYRDHGHMLACGMESRGVMAELTGRRGGILAARAVLCTCSAEKKIFWWSWHCWGTSFIGWGISFRCQI